ncbi:hypothetical protein J6590_036132 [Homalodisca vitripennis]|nr:hypothetical protein J6590_036132 [Homalodisca vitripennis]
MVPHPRGCKQGVVQSRSDLHSAQRQILGEGGEAGPKGKVDPEVSPGPDKRRSRFPIRPIAGFLTSKGSKAHE